MAMTIGDIVQLKSGGPKMTVTELNPGRSGTGSVWTSWFAGAKHEKASFPIEALQTPVEPAAKKA